MYRFWKRTLAAVLTLGLVASLSACGGKPGFDASKYIKGILDENYLGQYDPDFLEMVDATESEAEEIYLGNLEGESNVFANVFSVDNMTGDVLDATMELYRQIYAKSKYTVDPATKIDDSTYGVKVTVEPIDVFHPVAEQLRADEPTSEILNNFLATYAETDFTTISEEDYAAYDAAWAQMIIDMTYEALETSGYLEPQSLVLQVTKDSDGVWGISDTDLSNFDYLVIDYNF